MPEKWEVNWSDEFISGNKEIDGYHKEIIDGVVELHKLYDDPSKFKDQIHTLAGKIQEDLLTHMDIEIKYLKRFNIPGCFSHEASHESFRKKLELYNRYEMGDLIHGLLISEVALDYMKEHFFMFDTRDLPKINEKLKEAGELQD